MRSLVPPGKVHRESRSHDPSSAVSRAIAPGRCVLPLHAARTARGPSPPVDLGGGRQAAAGVRRDIFLPRRTQNSYLDGLRIEVTETWVGHRLAFPVAELNVVVRNGSRHTFDVWLIGELQYGPQRRAALRCPIAPPYGDPGSVQLIAIGETSYPYPLCFVLPPTGRHDVVFEVQIDAGMHEPAVFAGGL